MDELQLIAELQRRLASSDPRLLLGIGDDAAITRSPQYTACSVDTMVDGVHFRTGQLTGEEIGHRALAGALSDLAAMGLPGGVAYLGIGLPPGGDPAHTLAIVDGAAGLGRELGVPIAGGDVTAAPVLFLSVTVLGGASDPGAIVSRAGAADGDLVAVTGSLGGSGAGLALLDGRARLDAGAAVELHGRYARPRPRLAAGAALAAAGASAMIDLSDGLATDAGHVGRASGVQLVLELARLPVSAAVANVASQLGHDAGTFAAQAGEDYELCVCVPPAAREIAEAAVRVADPGAQLTWIGRACAGTAPGVRFSDAEGPLSGYAHSV